MARETAYRLIQDRRGMVWDLLLYVPTVIALASIGLKLWFSPNQTWAYVLLFMATFFLLVGANRVLGSRLMMLPSSPVALEVSRQEVVVELRRGERVSLVKDVRYYPDYAGKSFGLSGMDTSGKRRQFVFHRGQFENPSCFEDLRSLLSIYK
ncbi:MAG TPA: hypothetical protein ENK48_05685 [Gammaproteobacteria bacterium]|nr:hypothetical protein [Gammaproteobacteria bacterium]